MVKNILQKIGGSIDGQANMVFRQLDISVDNMSTDTVCFTILSKYRSYYFTESIYLKTTVKFWQDGLNRRLLLSETLVEKEESSVLDITHLSVTILMCINSNNT